MVCGVFPVAVDESSCTGVFYLNIHNNYRYDYELWTDFDIDLKPLDGDTAREVIDVPQPQQDYVSSLSPPPPGPFATAKTSSMSPWNDFTIILLLELLITDTLILLVIIINYVFIL